MNAPGTFEQVAVEFAQSLVEARWENARSLLMPGLQLQWSAQQLAEMFKSMCDYGSGPATAAHFDPQFSMETWPAKQPGDVARVYVSIEGADFVEAVTVTIAALDGGFGIRCIEWGRP